MAPCITGRAPSVASQDEDEDEVACYAAYAEERGQLSEYLVNAAYPLTTNDQKYYLILTSTMPVKIGNAVLLPRGRWRMSVPMYRSAQSINQNPRARAHRHSLIELHSSDAQNCTGMRALSRARTLAPLPCAAAPTHQ